MKKHRIEFLFVCITIVIFIAMVMSVCIGKYHISLNEIIDLIAGRPVAVMTRRVLLNLRISRTIMALMAGIGLGLSGNIYQTVFKNPLASPSIIGVAGGANLGAAVCIVMFSSASTITIVTGAFWGGLLALMCVLFLVRLTSSNSMATFVLAGIIINAVTKAVIMILKYFADPENELAAMEYWEMGTLGNTTLSKLLPVIPVFMFGLIGLILLRRQIELMTLSDNECRALGVRLRVIRTAVLLTSTLLVASVISITGLISFVGLIGPHIAKLLLKKNNSTAMFMSGCIGAVIVLFSDILARVMYSAELPISILTTVVGVPMLMYLMWKRAKEKI